MLFTLIDENGHKQTFDGIRAIIDKFPKKLKPYQQIVLVHHDGGIDKWVTEGELGFEELQRLYRMQECKEFDSIERVPCKLVTLK